MPNIGLDLGTFHTVISILDDDGNGVALGDSVRSIALRGSPPTVGRQVYLQSSDQGELVLAPKLLIRDPREDQAFIRQVLKQLAEQAIGFHVPDQRMGLSVPPGWTMEECEAFAESVRRFGVDVTFIHEPIALLVAAAFMAHHHEEASTLLPFLRRPAQVLVCDWGAGTVDLALVSTRWNEKGGYEFRCMSEKTLRGHGGIDMAREIVDSLSDAPMSGPRSRDRVMLDLQLQTGWEDGMTASEVLGGHDRRSELESYVHDQRVRHASVVAAELASLRSSHVLDDNLLVLLHGGPLEAVELRDLVTESLARHGVKPARIHTLGSEYCRGLRPASQPWRRDSLVSLGAAIFAAKGRALPEYEYRVMLRDGAQRPTQAARLVKGHNLRGLVAVEPPFMGQDYWVDVQQVRDDVPTPLQKALGIFIREDALIMYEIAEVGVGYSRIEAYEGTRALTPQRLGDARSAMVDMPEKSTRFQISI